MRERLRGEERCLPRGSASAGTTEAARPAAVPRLVLTFPACFLPASGLAAGSVSSSHPPPPLEGPHSPGHERPASPMHSALAAEHTLCCSGPGFAAGMVAPACAPPQAQTTELRDADPPGAAGGQLISRAPLQRACLVLSHWPHLWDILCAGAPGAQEGRQEAGRWQEAASSAGKCTSAVPLGAKMLWAIQI